MILSRNVLMLSAAVALVALPLVIGVKGEFASTDDMAQGAIASLDPHYQRWAKPVWQPPSTEVESLLFALQAAIGAGVLGYVLGFRRGRGQGK
jgi:cobalt/nickel transport protein